MARPIKETPVLKGEDARRFVQRMNETRTESSEKKRRRQANYKLAMSILVNN